MHFLKASLETVFEVLDLLFVLDFFSRHGSRMIKNPLSAGKQQDHFGWPRDLPHQCVEPINAVDFTSFSVICITLCLFFQYREMSSRRGRQ